MSSHNQQNHLNGGTDFAGSCAGSEGDSSLNLEERIKSLEKELHRLRKERYFRLRQAPDDSHAGADYAPEALTMDHDLQKQVLMLTEAMPHMVWIADSEGKCTHANNRFYELTGLDRDKDDGWSWVNFLHPDDFEKTIAAGNQASKENRPFSIELRHKDFQGN